MKNCSILLIFLLLAPPMQAHIDVVVYNNILEHLHKEDAHEKEHHKNDSEKEKNTEHHHHCTIVNISLTFLPVYFNFNFLPISTKKREANFYPNLYYSSYLNGVFHPPKV